jgi:hypothetical protein
MPPTSAVVLRIARSVKPTIPPPRIVLTPIRERIRSSDHA